MFQASHCEDGPVTTDTTSLPTPRNLAGVCPWCGRDSNFSLHNTAELERVNVETEVGSVNQPSYLATVITCMGCRRSTVVITTYDGKGVHWYPAPGAGVLDPAVPHDIASTFDEGMRCLAIGANRAAAVMFRSALHLFVKDKGNDAASGERQLKTALKKMKESGTLHPSLSDWADHLNQLGNEGAHPEDYDEVTAEEAAALGRFVRHLIKHEYEMPAELVRARELGESQQIDRI